MNRGNRILIEAESVEEWGSAVYWAALAKEMGINPAVMPHTKQRVNIKAVRESWPSRPRAGVGGGFEYPLNALPQAFQSALRGWRTRRMLLAERVEAAAEAVVDLPDEGNLKSYQRVAMEARLILLAEVDRLILTGSSQGRAVTRLVDLAARRELEPVLQRAVARANVRGNRDRTLTRSTVYGWLQARARADGAVVALAPVAKEEAPVPVWAVTFMSLYCQPAKPSIPMVLEDFWPQTEAKPNVDQVRRFLKRVDTISRHRGRVGPRDLRKFKAYVARDTSELWPGAIFCGDGHTFKAEVAHPIHGRPFRPEITMIVDVYTRRVVGWSVALSENTSSVADALRHALVSATSCDIFYYDNGSGAKNAAWDDQVTGLAARLCIAKEHSRAYNSQARGVIERRNSTILHRAAKKLATYIGQDMDREARQQAYKITRKDIARVGVSRFLTGWADFIALIDAGIKAANARECEGLPKIADFETIRHRHLSPDEMWARAVEGGWQPDPLDADEARDLFRPVEIRKTNRALVELFGNEYFGGATLEALHGERVQVAYDIHDASKVWVRDMQGRFLCEAIWSGHKTSYFPVEKAKLAREQRVAGMVKRHREHIAVAEAELRSPMLEHQPGEPLWFHIAEPERELVPVMATPVEAVASVVATPRTQPNGRPIFIDDMSMVRWLLAHQNQITESDRLWLREELRSHNFRLSLDFEGVDVATLRELSQRTEAA